MNAGEASAILETFIIHVSVFSGGGLVAAPLAACVDGIDPLHQKFSVKANVAVGIVINALALMAIRRHRKYITPRIVQDDDSTGVGGYSRQARHNKSLATMKAIPIFGMVYLASAILLYVFSKAKGNKRCRPEMTHSSLLTLSSLTPYPNSWISHQCDL